MGGRLSSAGNSNGNESSMQSGTAGLAVAGIPQQSPVSAAGLASGIGAAQSSQPGTSAAGGGSSRSSAASKNTRLPESPSVVNGRQLLEVLAASGVSGRTVITRSRPSADNGSRSSDESSALNRTLLTTSLPFLIAFRGKLEKHPC